MSCYGLYEVLQCSKDASYEDLKKNYHRLALQHHPDKMKPENFFTNDAEYRKIARAWSILRNPQSRRKYDAECKQAELESTMGPICRTITVDDMVFSLDGEQVTYRCTCGTEHTMDRLEVADEGCIHYIPCENCTFVVAIET